MRRQAAFTITLTALFAVLAVTQAGIAQSLPVSDAQEDSLVHVTECNVQRLYTPGAFRSPALHQVGAEVLDDEGADGPLYELLLPAPIGGALSIRYTNATNRVMTSIAFGLVVSGTLVSDVRDAGKFTSNAEIHHDFMIDANVFPLGGEPQCVVLSIAYADGISWTNPHPPLATESHRPSKNR
jgi:hypothetical protein